MKKSGKNVGVAIVVVILVFIAVLTGVNLCKFVREIHNSPIWEENSKESEIGEESGAKYIDENGVIHMNSKIMVVDHVDEDGVMHFDWEDDFTEEGIEGLEKVKVSLYEDENGVVRFDQKEGTEEEKGSSSKGKVSVSASSSVVVVPDIGDVNLTIYVEDKNREIVLKSISDTTDKVLKGIYEDGVNEKDVSVSNNGVNPVYGNLLAETLTGYSSTTYIKLKNQSVGGLGAIIGDAIENGVSRVEEIRYHYSKYDEAYSQALEEAILEAKRKAMLMAETMGKSLEDDFEISEGYQNTSMRYNISYFDSLASSSEKGMGSDDYYSVDIQPGENEITASVDLSCTLQ